MHQYARPHPRKKERKKETEGRRGLERVFSSLLRRLLLLFPSLSPPHSPTLRNQNTGRLRAPRRPQVIRGRGSPRGDAGARQEGKREFSPSKSIFFSPFFSRRVAARALTETSSLPCFFFSLSFFSLSPSSLLTTARGPPPRRGPQALLLDARV